MEGKKYCFLCKKELNEINSSEEHVIPRWLQEKYQLWDKRIYLLNRTTINYRQLTIPCCKECNNRYLSYIENKISKAHNAGISEFRKIEYESLFLWLGKIYYGMTYRELSLRMNIEDKTEGSIVSKEYLDQFKMHHKFLTQIFGEHKFLHGVPSSLFIVELQEPEETELKWDYFDSHNIMFIGMRMGKIGIISALQDGGILKYFENDLSEYFKFPLHPIQFKELGAKILYKNMLLKDHVGFFTIYDNNGGNTVVNNPTGEIFDEWDNNTYHHILAQMTNYPLKKIISDDPTKTYTWMTDSTGKALFIDINKEW